MEPQARLSIGRQAIAKQSAERRIYRELELNLRIKPRKRLQPEKPEPLAVPEAPNEVWSMGFMVDQLAPSRQNCFAIRLLGNGWQTIPDAERVKRLQPGGSCY
jgi:hypothetical protein